ncbi:hypothetical protein GF354_00540 [Candidatus Peregrinibacteria bacterium]|nr:hypothetical protein [Candidatus Peregrinibacteria bacterium]
MKTNRVKKIKTQILASFFSILFVSLFCLNASASTSSDFFLDYETVSTGADTGSSSSFEMLSGVNDAETNSSSSSFKLTTINLIPDSATYVCGNGVIDPGELCDGTNFGGISCSTYGYDQGSLTCISCVVIDQTSCSSSTAPTVITTPSSGDGGPIYHIQSGQLVDEEEEEEPYTPDEPSVPTEPQVPTEPTPPTTEPEPTPVTPSEPEQITKPITYTPPTGVVQVPTEPSPDKTTETPTPIPKEQKPHFTYFTPTEIIQTIDNKPVLADELKPNTEYVITVTNSEGEVVQELNIETDSEGAYVYEIPTELTDGDYNFKIYEVVLQTEKDYKLSIVDKDYPAIRIERFGEIEYPVINTKYQIDIGGISLDTHKFISGYTIPQTRVIAYFQSERVYTVEDTADENGYFELEIPSDLELGEHTATIVQIFPDKTISENLVYRFSLIEAPINQEELRSAIAPSIEQELAPQSLRTILYLILITLGLIIAGVLAQKPLHK